MTNFLTRFKAGAYIAIFWFLLFFSLLFVCNLQKKDAFYDYFAGFCNVEFCYITNCGDAFTSNHIVQTNNCQFVYFDKDCSNVNMNKVLYKQVSFDKKSFNKLKFFNDFNIYEIKSEFVDDIAIIYGYSPSFKEVVYVNENKINFQIAIGENVVTIGYPMIFGSY